MIGASAGGLVVVLAACDVNLDRAVREAYRLSVENDIWSRPAGLAGIWGGLVRDWLDELVPPDADERCAGRVKLVVTEALTQLWPPFTSRSSWMAMLQERIEGSATLTGPCGIFSQGKTLNSLHVEDLRV